MNAKKLNQPVLGEKIPMVGRKPELDSLRQKLLSRGDSHAVYFVGGGGVGKTRILRELVNMVDEAGPGYLSTDIIDLFHTDNHSPSDLERILVDRLDPVSNEHPKGKYFTHYREAREEYTVLRELGAGTETLERMRAQLASIFQTEWGLLANEQRKLVVILDTMELLQYESSKVEEFAGLDTVNTRIKPWILGVLPKLPNLLVVFAGRPKTGSFGENLDHQGKIEADFLAAFGKEKLKIVRLTGLNIDEMREFLAELCGTKQIIPSTITQVVHKCTGGAPIFLHLIVDLFQRLTPHYRALAEWFEEHKALINLPEGDAELETARQNIKIKILDGIFNHADTLGLYLSQIAMMPKGIDQEILLASLGMQEKEAKALLSQLENLSFVKRFQPPVEGTGLYERRLFLHDEMYLLFYMKGIVPEILLNEKRIANTLVNLYYAPHIRKLEEEILHLEPQQRSSKRHELETLQVERLHYLMIQSPLDAFEEYKRLTNEANRRRASGFSMRLHDEFLRFYNRDERRAQFNNAGISHEQVVRESAELWVERYHWWGQHNREVVFAEKIFEHPSEIFLSPTQHVEILGNICALWGRAKVMTEGYSDETAAKVKSWLDLQPPLNNLSTYRQKLARARLATTLGFIFEQGNRFSDAIQYYAEAQIVFEGLDSNVDEWAMLLNNLAYIYARRGNFGLAEPLITRAQKLNKSLGNEERYSAGLTYSVLAVIRRMLGNYPYGIKYAERALKIFEKISDPWGQIRALRHIANSKRRLAKDAIRKELELADAYTQIIEARNHLLAALKIAEKEKFGAQADALFADLGKIYRENGRLATNGFGSETPEELYRESEKYFKRSLRENSSETLGVNTNIVEKANTSVDLAELLFYSHATAESLRYLGQVEKMIGPSYILTPDGAPLKNQVVNYFIPLGMAERLRGEIEFKDKNYAKGLLHFYQAYIYFNLFSEEATEKQTIIDFVYNSMQTLPVEERKLTIANLHKTVDASYSSYEPSGFIPLLHGLLG